MLKPLIFTIFSINRYKKHIRLYFLILLHFTFSLSNALTLASYAPESSEIRWYFGDYDANTGTLVLSGEYSPVFSLDNRAGSPNALYLSGCHDSHLSDLETISVTESLRTISGPGVTWEVSAFTPAHTEIYETACPLVMVWKLHPKGDYYSLNRLVYDQSQYVIELEYNLFNKHVVLQLSFGLVLVSDSFVTTPGAPPLPALHVLRVPVQRLKTANYLPLRIKVGNTTAHVGDSSLHVCGRPCQSIIPVGHDVKMEDLVCHPQRSLMPLSVHYRLSFSSNKNVDVISQSQMKDGQFLYFHSLSQTRIQPQRIYFRLLNDQIAPSGYKREAAITDATIIVDLIGDSKPILPIITRIIGAIVMVACLVILISGIRKKSITTPYHC